jgi:hypothetical protein
VLRGVDLAIWPEEALFGAGPAEHERARMRRVGQEVWLEGRQREAAALDAIITTLDARPETAAHGQPSVIRGVGVPARTDTAIASIPDAVMVNWPDAAQDRLQCQYPSIASSTSPPYNLRASPRLDRSMPTPDLHCVHAPA